jgi:hypothetical protein
MIPGLITFSLLLLVLLLSLSLSLSPSSVLQQTANLVVYGDPCTPEAMDE